MVLNILIKNFAFMKEIVTILLSLWISLTAFLPKSDIHYLGDMSNLLKHFQEHQAQENLDFWQFLWLHYANTRHQKQDQNHKHLPLHHHHAECVSLIVLPYTSFEIQKQIQPINQIKNYLDWQSFYRFQLTKEDVQPPRV